MIGRIVEISENGRHLSVYRGFLVVSQNREELARIPLDDIGVILANAHQLTYSNALLLELCERGIGFIFCGSNHSPAGMLWPMDSHHQQTGVMRAQLDASVPLCKQLWKQLIQAKLTFQQEALIANGREGKAFEFLIQKVRSGDPDNIEAQAARIYWPALMGKGFTRDKNGAGVNGLLNYGYAILRSTVARGVMAAGLHPSLGVHHRNRLNPMCLVDDVMEPFRPLIDNEVMRIIKTGNNMEVNPQTKQALVLAMLKDCLADNCRTPASVAVQRLCTSIAAVYQNKTGRITLPDRLIIEEV